MRWKSYTLWTQFPHNKTSNKISRPASFLFVCFHVFPDELLLYTYLWTQKQTKRKRKKKNGHFISAPCWPVIGLHDFGCTRGSPL